MISDILKTVIHPEQDKDIVSLGMVQNFTEQDGKIRFTLQLTKAHDPMAQSIKRSAEAAIIEATGIAPTIIIAEPNVRKRLSNVPKPPKLPLQKTIAIASGKGGVGKSTVTANLAVALARLGYRVGVIDADIYGPSMPKMFGVEGYMPVTEDDNSQEIIPAQSHGVKVMSIGFFIKAEDALVWRGPMATNALKQLINQTAWGELDYLLIDLPPGTGDVHLTAVGALKIDGAIVVSTPGKVALLDVVRGIGMLRSKNVNIPIIGIINNMAYFTPAELPDNKYYIFGRGELEKVAQEMRVEVLAEIPLVQSIAENGDSGKPLADGITEDVFMGLAKKISADGNENTF